MKEINMMKNETLNQEIIPWAVKYLADYKNSTVLNHKRIINTSYSTVWRLETTTGIFYLKQVPEALFVESKMLAFLQEQGFRTVPELLAENKLLHCFIMVDCGDHSLRTLFNGKVDFNQLTLGIVNYTTIQRALETKIKQLFLLGLPDWRLNEIPSLYSQLILQDNLLLKGGLTRKEIDRLHQLHSACTKLCDDLSQYNIPETISHCDFHDNNMLFASKAGSINIIDWGETVVSHPFFSLNGCLWNLTYFHKINKTDALYSKLQSHCIAPWLDFLDEKKLLKAFNIANHLSGIYAALCSEVMHIATKGQLGTVQHTHKGQIAGCLRSFLNILS